MISLKLFTFFILCLTVALVQANLENKAVSKQDETLLDKIKGLETLLSATNDKKYQCYTKLDAEEQSRLNAEVEKNSLLKKNQELVERITELENESTLKTEEIQELSTQLDSKKEESLALKSANDKLLEENQSCRENKESLEKLKTSLLSSLEEKAEELTTANNDKENCINELNNEKVFVAASNLIRDKLLKEKNTCEEALKDLKSSNISVFEKLEKKEEELLHLTDEKEKCNIELDNEKQAKDDVVKKLSKTIKACEETGTLLQNSTTSLEKSAKDLSMEIAEKENCKIELHKEKELVLDVTSIKDKLLVEKKTCEEAIANLKNSNTLAFEKLENKEQELLTAISEKEKCNSELVNEKQSQDETVKKLSETVKTCEETEAQLQNSTVLLEKIAENLSSLNNEKKNCTYELNKEKELNAELVFNEKKLKEEKNTCEETISNFKSSNTTAFENLEKKDQELFNVMNEKEKCYSELDNEKLAKDDALRKLTETVKSCEETESQLRNSTTLLGEVAKNLSLLNIEKDNCTNELNKEKELSFNQILNIDKLLQEQKSHENLIADLRNSNISAFEKLEIKEQELIKAIDEKQKCNDELDYEKVAKNDTVQKKLETEAVLQNLKISSEEIAKNLSLTITGKENCINELDKLIKLSLDAATTNDKLLEEKKTCEQTVLELKISNTSAVENLDKKEQELRNVIDEKEKCNIELNIEKQVKDTTNGKLSEMIQSHKEIEAQLQNSTVLIDKISKDLALVNFEKENCSIELNKERELSSNVTFIKGKLSDEKKTCEEVVVDLKILNISTFAKLEKKELELSYVIDEKEKCSIQLDNIKLAKETADNKVSKTMKSYKETEELLQNSTMFSERIAKNLSLMIDEKENCINKLYKEQDLTLNMTRKYEEILADLKSLKVSTFDELEKKSKQLLQLIDEKENCTIQMNNEIQLKDAAVKTLSETIYKNGNLSVQPKNWTILRNIPKDTSCQQIEQYFLNATDEKEKCIRQLNDEKNAKNDVAKKLSEAIKKCGGVKAEVQSTKFSLGKVKQELLTAKGEMKKLQNKNKACESALKQFTLEKNQALAEATQLRSKGPNYNLTQICHNNTLDLQNQLKNITHEYEALNTKHRIITESSLQCEKEMDNLNRERHYYKQNYVTIYSELEEIKKSCKNKEANCAADKLKLQAACHRSYDISSPSIPSPPEFQPEISQKQITVNDYVYELGDSSYKMYNNAKNWSDARKSCLLDDAHLAIINTETEEKLLIEMLNENQSRIKNALVKFEAHIGISDYDTRGKWMTVLGEPLSALEYVRWSSFDSLKRQPDNHNGNEHCGAVIAIYDGGMNDVPCETKLAYICERPIIR